MSVPGLICGLIVFAVVFFAESLARDELGRSFGIAVFAGLVVAFVVNLIF